MRMAVARADAATLLVRALRVSAGAHGVSLDAVAIADRPWASATFEGVRHEVRLTLGGDRANDWLATLADAELPMRGNIVADLCVDSIGHDGTDAIATLTALTLAER